MATNVLPDGLDDLFTLAEDMADGLQQDALNATPIDIKQNTETVIRAALAVAVTEQSAFNAARGQKKSLGGVITIADSNGKAFIGVARNILKPALGDNWSEAWLPTGFPNQSLAVPATISERQALLKSLQGYFAANAAQQNAPLNITTARALLLFDALSTARSASIGHLTVSGQKKTARETAVNALRKRMSGLIDELAQLLDENDPRWYGFGLNPPGALDTPEIPDAPVLTSSSANTIYADWTNAPRAAHYRVWRQIVGTDADFVAADTVSDSDATLTGLTSGATVRIRVTAVNDAGESQPGPTAEITVA